MLRCVVVFLIVCVGAFVLAVLETHPSVPRCLEPQSKLSSEQQAREALAAKHKVKDNPMLAVLSLQMTLMVCV